MQVYVVGGIADRTVQKNMTLGAARELRVAARRLPLAEHLPQRGAPVLNIDTVVAVLAAVAKSGDWKQALLDRYWIALYCSVLYYIGYHCIAYQCTVYVCTVLPCCHCCCTVVERICWAEFLKLISLHSTNCLALHVYLFLVSVPLRQLDPNGGKKKRKLQQLLAGEGGKEGEEKEEEGTWDSGGKLEQTASPLPSPPP
jgi:hypothetical protein